MALPTSGPISLAMIQAEFGGPTPISISNYYRGGAYVPNNSFNAAIPTGGAISLSQFYGARAYTFAATAAGTPPLNKRANSGSITSNAITATPSGNLGSVSYAWSIVSHDDPDTTPTINSSTSQTCTVTTTESPLHQRTITVTVHCTCTDTATGTAVVTNSVTISHDHDNGA